MYHIYANTPTVEAEGRRMLRLSRKSSNNTNGRPLVYISAIW